MIVCVEKKFPGHIKTAFIIDREKIETNYVKMPLISSLLFVCVRVCVCCVRGHRVEMSLIFVHAVCVR